MTDYAELWLMAQRSHKDIFEAALRKDWINAQNAAMVLETYAAEMREWFREQSDD